MFFLGDHRRRFLKIPRDLRHISDILSPIAFKLLILFFFLFLTKEHELTEIYQEAEYVCLGLPRLQGMLLNLYCCVFHCKNCIRSRELAR